MQTRRFLGVTVMPEYVQVEGIDRVLDNLAKMGATAVTTSPYVMETADAKTGNREPPDDAGAGAVRLLDRPLWGGRRELFVRTAPSFVPDRKLYQGLRYQPAEATELTRKQGAIVRDFLRAAQGRHLKTYLQVQAAIPPGYRVQFGGPVEADRPRLPDGRVPPRRLAKNGSLASAHIRDYEHALIRDLCRAYPDVDGIRFDWPEYPPYFLDDVFLDFSDAARDAARRLDFDFVRMRNEAGALYRVMHGGLTDAHLNAWLDGDGGRYSLLTRMLDHPGLVDWLRFKTRLSEELITGFRQALTQAAGAKKELIAHAFPPPFSLASGIDFARIGRHANGIAVKLYTMHWSMMLRFYGDALMKANPRLTERVLVRFLVRLFDIADDDGSPRLADYGYPAPNVAHPAGLQAQSRKITQAQREAGTTPIFALAHGYGRVDDFRRRLGAAWQASGQKVWINRYAYLSDEKIKVVGEVCR